MKFVDQVELEATAGKGGDGIISFRHESRIEKGGPDGGDGGAGGHIYFQGDPGMNTLLPLHLLKHIRGHDGANGRAKNMYGAKGKDVIVKVPCGTLVYEAGELVCDVVDSQRYLVCRGGRGGHGNTRFKSSRNTVPRVCENGILGQKRRLLLELKVLADVGLVGKPCAGKSSLLKVLSNAKPKVSDYDFTTLVPQLGLVQTSDDNSFVIADLPGLIAGASQGKGLGLQFLRHIERCKVIAFIIDFGSATANPSADLQTLRAELAAYDWRLLDKALLVVANKCDLPEFPTHLAQFQHQHPEVEVVAISALAHRHLEHLKRRLFEIQMQATPPLSNVPAATEELFVQLEPDFTIDKPHEGLYEISGAKVETIYQRIPLTTYENILRFNKKLKDLGLWQALIDRGIAPGDTVRICNYQFSWEDD